MLVAPVSYQGAKQRLASEIVDRLDLRDQPVFYDLCCGSGAVSIELVNRGYDPRLIRMVDAGPWGLFWNAVGQGEFLLNTMEHWCNQVPTDKHLIKNFMEDLSRQPVDYNAVYVFLLLQAASFGGKAIWIDRGRWQNCSFRSYWQPTATSSRRSPVNPMMPMAETLLERSRRVASAMYGVGGGCCRLEDMAANIGENAVVYIDPPYGDTTGYGHTIDVMKFIDGIGCRAYVSEGRPLSSQATMLDGGRAKGGISGDRKVAANQEWLSAFNQGAT